MHYVTSSSLESFRIVFLRWLKMALVIALGFITVTFFGCTRNIDLPGGMSEEAFHVKADGQEHILTGYINSNEAVAPISYLKHCAVINNTPSKYTLRVSKLREGSPPEVLAETVKYEAQLKEGLYLIEARTPLGEVTDFCHMRVDFKDEDPDFSDL